MSVQHDSTVIGRQMLREVTVAPIDEFGRKVRQGQVEPVDGEFHRRLNTDTVCETVERSHRRVVVAENQRDGVRQRVDEPAQALGLIGTHHHVAEQEELLAAKGSECPLNGAVMFLHVLEAAHLPDERPVVPEVQVGREVRTHASIRLDERGTGGGI